MMDSHARHNSFFWGLLFKNEVLEMRNNTLIYN